ncbi:MAG: 50S ribosomal protein L35 [Candidatus Sungbacteria bacterium]|uniref:50S ribosomal protein L35 n=1 Tax=Candidatus Sungiibacteriota bacterium TaxID=2750080 RepID=A0A933DR95_9BACT|nr:50S ribosomal protein L35 [Candidatus Sungbacteria bacterium]
MAKPNKSIRKRIKLTKTGKLIRRVAGQNHFNAKESGRMRRRKGTSVPFPRSFRREILARL